MLSLEKKNETFGKKILFLIIKTKNPVHHQHKNQERNHRNYNAKIIHLWTKM